MKTLVTSDLHGNISHLDLTGIDLCLIAGDFTLMSGFSRSCILEQINWIRTVFIPFCEKHDNVMFCIVPGNHDICFEQHRLKDAGITFDIEWPDNVKLLIDEMFEFNGIKIYGTPYVPIISYRWAFEAEHDKLVEKFNCIPDDVDVLLTHTPPRIPNESFDISLQYNDPRKFGSSELTDAIMSHSPRYAFCGHIHSGSHVPVKFNNTIVCNVSRLNEDYCIAYEPYVFDLTHG